MVVRRNALNGSAKVAESMEEDVAKVGPIAKFNPNLVGAIARLEELAFVNAEEAVQLLENGNGSFSNTDNPDFLGLDERDPQSSVRKGSREHAGRHPAGSPAADDQNVANGILVHEPIPTAATPDRLSALSRIPKERSGA